jgi:hypothetical protein
LSFSSVYTLCTCTHARTHYGYLCWFPNFNCTPFAWGNELQFLTPFKKNASFVDFLGISQLNTSLFENFWGKGPENHAEKLSLSCENGMCMHPLMTVSRVEWMGIQCKTAIVGSYPVIFIALTLYGILNFLSHRCLSVTQWSHEAGNRWYSK